MRSLTLRFLKQILPSSAAAVALLGLIGIASPARADDYSLCPSAANQGGFGSDVFTINGCAVTESLTLDTDYARLMWDSTVTNYPASLTLGNLASISANVTFAADQSGDQPYYELAFFDSSDSLGQGNATDQILMLQFQTTTLSGGTLAVDPNATEFNLYDNDTGVYLAGGQQDTNTLNGWLSTYSFLNGVALQQVRIGIGLAGGPCIGPCSESLTVNSLDIETPNNGAVPEPTSILLLLTVVGITGKGIYRRLPQNHRS